MCKEAPVNLSTANIIMHEGSISKALRIYIKYVYHRSIYSLAFFSKSKNGPERQRQHKCGYINITQKLEIKEKRAKIKMATKKAAIEHTTSCKNDEHRIYKQYIICLHVFKPRKLSFSEKLRV